ncbi:hypothetical protein [uncultured Tyzzerella sp.]|uniref:hypothetical protein n=1 Tax=uncultured Tyzzerella sp. TaxID=2321398 RepID=UPI0029428047|nr:hypothetical protein [uncultured Tyzzerella sp.]
MNFGKQKLSFAVNGNIDNNIHFSNSNNSGVEINFHIKNYTYKNGRYEKADYHGKIDNNRKSKAPIDGQDALDNSIEISNNTKRRIAISNNEIVILDETINGIYHGHVRKWEDLDPKMRAVLIRAGLLNKKGKIK